MRTLIVEDDFIARRLLKEILTPLGDCDVAINGREAVQAFRMALDDKKPYDLITMDIMMPGMDGQEALKLIREIEKERSIPPSSEVKVIMTTALDDPKNVVEAYYHGGATSYIVKPISKGKLMNEIRGFGLLA
ncbi:response regulator [Geobacter sp. DSM 9736]|uniref:response regulator n=1 Tax=Geobacter sp. DSM 9736 TaxID=1277350 RepID=UPI000B50FA15|nr:response regulator [Geobacter sp. DSM 9736]SNB44781.1 two-component system, chemotaxis family, response regulator CheY [Geobacter sp. DSM 9736]